MPRGSGKSALCMALCLWAILSGLRDFVLLIGASKDAAKELLDSIKSELENNQLLANDFPREVGPFRLLGGEARMALGQRWGEKRTGVGWKSAEVVFANVPGSKSAGSVIRVTGITGRIRGAIHTKQDGTQIGPSLVVADDPQTDASAKSLTQTDARERAILSTTKGLARVGVRIGIMVPCTVIRREDLADRLMDRKRHPDIRSKRTKMLYSMPERLDLWDQYAQVYADDKVMGGDGASATDFYRSNQDEMDCGAKAGWDHNFEPGEISAVQHAMNWYLFNREGFFSECQQTPLEEVVGTGRIAVADVLAKINGRSRFSIPLKCEYLVAFIDINEPLLYYQVTAWEPNFTGYCVDYGAWPEQPDRYFTMATCRNPLSKAYAGRGKEGSIHAGLSALLDKLFSQKYVRDDGAVINLDVCGIDSGFDQDVVAQVIRAQGRGKQLLPTKGVGFTADKKPFSEYNPEPGTVIGHHWRKSVAPKIQMLALNFDANRWKSFCRNRLKVALGDPTSFSIYGDRKRPDNHQMYAEHKAAEAPVDTEGPWGKLEVWRLPPSRPDNHLGDCDVGCAVLASTLGCRLPEWGMVRPARRRIRLSELQASRR